MYTLQVLGMWEHLVLTTTVHLHLQTTLSLTTSTNEEIILDPAGTGKVVIDSDLDLDSNQIINVADPTSNQHAATKAYVDPSCTRPIPR